MKIGILRLTPGDFGKIGTYNVQEIGLAEALGNLGHETFVFFTNRTVPNIERDEMYDYVYYLPHLRLGLHGIINFRHLERFKLDALIIFGDNQLQQGALNSWCKKHRIQAINYFGAVLSTNPRILNQAYTKAILRLNRPLFLDVPNVAKTETVMEEMGRLGVPCACVINVGLSSSLLGHAVSSAGEGHETVLGNGKYLLLYVGRFVPNKRPLWSIEVLKRARMSGLDAHLIAIGNGVLRPDFSKLVEDLGLEDHVTHLERVNHTEMARYYSAADCLVNFSAEEIFGMAMMEAMFYGCPVVARDAAGPREFLRDRANGYVCYSDDPGEFVDGIRYVLANRGQLSSEAKRTIATEFMWEGSARKFVDVIEGGTWSA